MAGRESRTRAELGLNWDGAETVSITGATHSPVTHRLQFVLPAFIPQSQLGSRLPSQRMRAATPSPHSSPDPPPPTDRLVYVTFRGDGD